VYLNKLMAEVDSFFLPTNGGEDDDMKTVMNVA